MTVTGTDTVQISQYVFVQTLTTQIEEKNEMKMLWYDMTKIPIGVIVQFNNEQSSSLPSTQTVAELFRVKTGCPSLVNLTEDVRKVSFLTAC